MVLDLILKRGNVIAATFGEIESRFLLFYFLFFKDGSSGRREEITFVGSAVSRGFCEADIFILVSQMRE